MKKRVPYLYLVPSTSAPEPLPSLVDRSSVILPAQLRAARSLLDWGRAECAQQAGLSAETIRNIEHGRYRPHMESCTKIIEAFARHSVEFIRHESIIQIPSLGNQPSHTATVTYAGAVLVTATFHRENPND